jgi:hypothetical protein
MHARGSGVISAEQLIGAEASPTRCAALRQFWKKNSTAMEGLLRQRLDIVLQMSGGNVTVIVIGFTLGECPRENIRESRLGCELRLPNRRAAISERKCLKLLGFYRSATRVSNLAGRQGVFRPISRNPNKDGRFQDNSHKVSELAFSDSFVGPRLFASVFGFCQCNDTRNDTRRERLRSSSHRKRP